MILSSGPISCSKPPPQEGGARKGRMPLLAFNPPKRRNVGSKSSSLPFHWGHVGGTELLGVFRKEKAVQKGKVGYLGSNLSTT